MYEKFNKTVWFLMNKKNEKNKPHLIKNYTYKESKFKPIILKSLYTISVTAEYT